MIHWTSPLIKRVIKLRLSGLSEYNIAIQIGTTRGSIHYVLNHRIDPKTMTQIFRDAIWSENRIKQLRELRAQGLPFKECGKLIGVSRNAAIGAGRRYIDKIIDSRPTRAPRLRTGKGSLARPPDSWTERALTETWVERKARRAREQSLILSNTTNL